jgi:hypothetical protein
MLGGPIGPVIPGRPIGPVIPGRPIGPVIPGRPIGPVIPKQEDLDILVKFIVYYIIQIFYLLVYISVYKGFYILKKEYFNKNESIIIKTKCPFHSKVLISAVYVYQMFIINQV